MNPFGRITRARMVAVLLGLMGAACAAQRNASLPKDKALSHLQRATPSATTKPDTATKARVQTIYSKLPLHFEANLGQSDKQVQFLSRGHGYTLFLTDTEAVLALKQRSAVSNQQSASKTPLPNLQTLDSGLRTPNSELVLRLQLVGTNPSPQVTGLEELPGKVNYFLGNDPTQWRTNVPTYAKVKYQNVYPGVDLVYYGNQRQLEYDFVVAPGVDPRVIQLSVSDQTGP